jgi:hypothetical protein
MASDITITPRKLYLEDVATTTNPSGETASVNVLGEATNPVTLNKLALVLLTQFTQAANDAAAATAGVSLGEVYYSTALSALKARMT